MLLMFCRHLNSSHLLPSPEKSETDTLLSLLFEKERAKRCCGPLCLDPNRATYRSQAQLQAYG